MSQYILSKRAVDDIHLVGEYTIDRWGKAQAVRYLQGLEEALQKLADAPNTFGRKRDDLKKGYYSSLYENHVIFYKKQKAAIRIVRVLHQRRDIPEQLK